jgi:hypothetical protein
VARQDAPRSDRQLVRLLSPPPPHLNQSDSLFTRAATTSRTRSVKSSRLSLASPPSRSLKQTDELNSVYLTPFAVATTEKQSLLAVPSRNTTISFLSPFRLPSSLSARYVRTTRKRQEGDTQCSNKKGHRLQMLKYGNKDSEKRKRNAVSTARRTPTESPPRSAAHPPRGRCP